MKLFKKLFGEIEITWPLLLVYSVVTGVVVGLLNCVPFLENTSFVAPAVTLEYWFVAAIFIIANCKSAKESVIKTFLFFLISQPLIYLVEVPFNELGWGLFGYYKYWAIVTVLTIPGSWLAYQIKRDNVVSALVLSVATGFLLGTGVGAIKGLFEKFPYGLVAAIFCVMFSIILIQVILQKKNTRLIAYICTVVIAVAMTIVTISTSSNQSTGMMLDTNHQWEIVESDTKAEIVGSYLNISGKKDSTFTVILKNEDGEIVKYKATFIGTPTIQEVTD